MVALMLDAASHELPPPSTTTSLPSRFTPLGPGVPGSLRGEPQPRNRQAAFIPILVLVLGYLDDLGVEDVADLAVNIPGEGAQADPDLIGGQAGPAVLIDLSSRSSTRALTESSMSVIQSHSVRRTGSPMMRMSRYAMAASSHD